MPGRRRCAPLRAPARPRGLRGRLPALYDLSNAGAHLFRVKGIRALAAALDLVGAAADLCHRLGAPYFLENPRGQLRHYWREPDYQFDPCEYVGWLSDPAAEAYTKRTCLWTDHGFQMPEKRPVFPVQGSMVDKVSGSKNRANLRSLTPRGFSAAVFHAHHPASQPV